MPRTPQTSTQKMVGGAKAKKPAPKPPQTPQTPQTYEKKERKRT